MDTCFRYGTVLLEGVSPNAAFMTRVKKLILTARTKYQEVQIIEFFEYGRALVLDGYIQSTEFDEFMYHETLVHPAMTTHPKPERVLIVGGGEGATLREALKHSTVKEAVMVDIDGELVEFAKKYLDFMHQGSFDDPRVKLVIHDGFEWVGKESPKHYFDVVILDLTDPYGPEISRRLYSRDFYEMVKNVLRDGGIIVTQAGNSFFYPRTYGWVVRNVSSVYKVTREYWAWIPSFGYACNYIVASDSLDPASVPEDVIESRLRERGVRTRLYDAEYHTSLFKGKVVLGKVPEGVNLP